MSVVKPDDQPAIVERGAGKAGAGQCGAKGGRQIAVGPAKAADNDPARRLRRDQAQHKRPKEATSALGGSGVKHGLDDGGRRKSVGLAPDVGKARLGARRDHGSRLRRQAETRLRRRVQSAAKANRLTCAPAAVQA
jgi:hypothetical protein